MDDDGSNATAPKSDTESSIPKERLDQVKNQLAPTSPASSFGSSGSNSADTLRRRRRKSAGKDAQGQPPADYSDILGQISSLQKSAATPQSRQQRLCKAETGQQAMGQGKS